MSPLQSTASLRNILTAHSQLTGLSQHEPLLTSSFEGKKSEHGFFTRSETADMYLRQVLFIFHSVKVHVFKSK